MWRLSNKLNKLTAKKDDLHAVLIDELRRLEVLVKNAKQKDIPVLQAYVKNAVSKNKGDAVAKAWVEYVSRIVDDAIYDLTPRPKVVDLVQAKARATRKKAREKNTVDVSALVPNHPKHAKKQLLGEKVAAEKVAATMSKKKKA